MSFQQFLTEIKGCTIPEFLEKCAGRYENLPFLCRFEGEKITGYSFREVYQMAFRLAAGLKKLGIQTGDRVGLISENRPEWGVSYLGILATGAVVIPIDPHLKIQELEQIFQQAEMKAVIVSGYFFKPDLEPVRQIWQRHQITKDRKSTRLNSSHIQKSRMPSSA